MPMPTVVAVHYQRKKIEEEEEEEFLLFPFKQLRRPPLGLF